MAVGQRLGVGDIDRSPADRSRGQRLDQGIGVDMAAPGDVDQPGIGSHGREGGCVDDAGRLVGERQCEDDDVGEPKVIVQIIEGGHRGRHRESVPWNAARR